MGNPVILHAPAKINLFLHVIGRRADGYHQLQTVFRLLEFGDTVHVTARADGGVRMHPPTPGVPPQVDLCLRAARLLRSESGSRAGADIRVDKRIPAGGGLGGGSSDAAAVLRGLNVLWELNWDLGRLAALGARLGADVPVFVAGRDAWGEGIGEQLMPVELAPAWYVLVFPEVSVATAEVFADPDLPRDHPPITLDQWRQAPERAANDCQGVVLRRYRELAVLHKALAEYGPVAMSGTGSTFFLTFPDAKSARKVGNALGKRYNIVITPALGR